MLNPFLTFLRKSLYLSFDQIVSLLGGYGNYKRVFKLAELTGFIRYHYGYVGGASQKDYLEAIAQSFPELNPSHQRQILQKFWKDHQKIFLELFMYDKMRSDNIGNLVDFRGLENIETALSAGKGAILPVPHIGNIRLLHYCLSLKGYPVSVVSSGYSDDPEIVRRFKLEETSRIQQIGFRGEFPRWIIGALKENRLVQIASTAEAGKVGVEVEFLKRKLFLTSGWVRLAFITGSPILPTYIIRLSDGRHTVYIEPQFPLIECPDREEAIQRTAQTLMNHIEKIYRQYPHLIDWMSWQARLREASEHFNSKE